jgi:hypothetical protein
MNLVLFFMYKPVMSLVFVFFESNPLACINVL